MAIKVNIPNDRNTATIDGLYQWDYGQVLEIESTDLGTMIGEVHFACSSMSEAIVVSCNFTNGVGTVTIPNDCLEQSSTITAWVYEIAGTQGRTRKAITIPVTARTRPSAGHDIPTEITDQYTQLITNVNETIDKLENGQIAVKKAETATNAASATTAGNASSANYAVSAGSADIANKATVVKPNQIPGGRGDKAIKITSCGIFVVTFYTLDGYNTSVISITDLTNNARGAVCYCAPPDGSVSDSDYAMPYYNCGSGYLSVYHPKVSGTQMPILCVHPFIVFL